VSAKEAGQGAIEMAVARPESVATAKIERKRPEIAGFGWRRSCRLKGAGRRGFCKVAVCRFVGWGAKSGGPLPSKARLTSRCTRIATLPRQQPKF